MTSSTGSESDKRSNLPSNSSEDGLGLSNPQLSLGRRKMLDLVNKLHSTGVQVDIDLPQIAVIGSQSSGKSSLIESISGIRLPRAPGTCTRCPLECRLSRSDSPWQCVVFLRFITDVDGQPLGKARNEQFGAIIYDKNEIEDRIRRAQLAILTPKIFAMNFLTGDVDERPAQLSFSLNAVTLQISGPDVAEVSFCDLPGLIASVSSSSGSKQDDIALVENLATSYIKKPSCIILLTVAGETDFENQGAHCLAKKYDPKGKRTIGVLTKPDRIPTGEEPNWLPYIRNEKEHLKNNWFCVKQPSSSDLKLNPTWSGAREMENNFFASKAPWCELDGVYQPYLRTSNLINRLSSVLSNLISKRLPPIQKELEKAIRSTRDQLAQLPPAPSADPRSEIAALLHAFTSDLSRHVEGIPEDRGSSFGEGIGLIQAIRPAQERFRMMIRATAPKFKPFERSEEDKKRLGPAIFLHNEESEEEISDEDIREEEEGYYEDYGAGEGGEYEEDDRVYGVEKAKEGDSRKHKEPPGNVIYIDEVLERANRARARELPGNVPFVVQETFITSFTKEWADPAYTLCKTVHGTVSEHIANLVHKHFSGFGQGRLERNIQSIMKRHMRECVELAEEKITYLLELESYPFTSNTHYLADYETKFLAHYKGARDQYNRADFLTTIRQYRNSHDTAPGSDGVFVGNAISEGMAEPSRILKILSGLTEIGIRNVRPEDLAKLLPPDQMEPALDIMAKVRAYFQVAYKRFADMVPLTIDREIVRGASKDILYILYESLAVNGDQGEGICKDFAGESPEVGWKRADLQKKLKRLEMANEELLTIKI